RRAAPGRRLPLADQHPQQQAGHQLLRCEDRIRRLICDEIAPQVAQDQRYRNARANTPNTAEIELESALNRVVDPLFLSQAKFHKQSKNNALFRNLVREYVKWQINNRPGDSP
ncbi:MAG: hypothetical protein ACK559_25715, partial [bacterium]